MIEQNGKYTIFEEDVFLDEQETCPSCKSSVYSTKAIESKDLNTKLDKDSTKKIPPFALIGKCNCGHTWIETLTSNHKRSHIRGHFMWGKF